MLRFRIHQRGGRDRPRARPLGLLVLLAASLVGCSGLDPRSWTEALGNSDQPLRRDGRPLVITSFTVPASMAEAVACGRLQVVSLLAPGAEIHRHQPGERERQWLQQADLVLTHGLDLHPWMKPLLAAAGKAPVVDVTAGVQPRSIGSGERTGEPDPHAWMSPRQALRYVETIRDAFIALDPAQADAYRSCAAQYSAELRQIDASLTAQLGTIPPSQRLLVSCEGSLGYLASDYGLETLYLWPSQAKPAVDQEHRDQVVATVRERGVPAVFCESTFDDSEQRQVAEAAGARFGGTLFVDSLSGLDGLAPNYIALLRHNANKITAGLAGGAGKATAGEQAAGSNGGSF